MTRELDGQAAVWLKHFGELLATERRKRGLSQRALATQAGTTQSLVCDVERGKRNIRMHTLFKLCRIIGIDLHIIPLELLAQLDVSVARNH